MRSDISAKHVSKAGSMPLSLVKTDLKYSLKANDSSFSSWVRVLFDSNARESLDTVPWILCPGYCAWILCPGCEVVCQNFSGELVMKLGNKLPK